MKAVSPAYEQGVDLSVVIWQRMDGNPLVPPNRSNEGFGEERHAKTGLDAAYDRFKRAEFENTNADDSPMSQPRFENQPIRAAGSQDDHPQIVLSQIGIERRLAARRQDDQALLVHFALQQVGVMDRTAICTTISGQTAIGDG